jgi:hypothetical protein
MRHTQETSIEGDSRGRMAFGERVPAFVLLVPNRGLRSRAHGHSRCIGLAIDFAHSAWPCGTGVDAEFVDNDPGRDRRVDGGTDPLNSRPEEHPLLPASAATMLSSKSSLNVPGSSSRSRVRQPDVTSSESSPCLESSARRASRCCFAWAAMPFSRITSYPPPGLPQATAEPV